jgi:hypothetical protein
MKRRLGRGREDLFPRRRTGYRSGLDSEEAKMAHGPARALRPYLEDHLVGSEVGLRTARRLQRGAHGDLRAYAQELVTRIPQEEQVLRAVIVAAGRTVQPVELAARAFGTASSVGVWARRTVPESVPSILEDLEAMIVGVRGKRLVWDTMVRVAAADPSFDRWPFAELEAEAEEQERRLVEFRREVVSDLLGDPPAAR